jgi:hypothetical protein
LHARHSAVIYLRESAPFQAANPASPLLAAQTNGDFAKTVWHFLAPLVTFQFLAYCWRGEFSRLNFRRENGRGTTNTMIKMPTEDEIRNEWGFPSLPECLQYLADEVIELVENIPDARRKIVATIKMVVESAEATTCDLSLDQPIPLPRLLPPDGSEYAPNHASVIIAAIYDVAVPYNQDWKFQHEIDYDASYLFDREIRAVGKSQQSHLPHLDACLKAVKAFVKPNKFVSHANYYTVCFNGVDLPSIKSNLGMQYIEELLKNPNKTYAVWDLAKKINPSKWIADPRGTDALYCGEDADGNTSQGALSIGRGDGGDAIDDETSRAIKKRIKSGNPNEAELRTLKTYLNCNADLNGRPRKLNDPMEAFRVAVQQAISRAQTELRKHSPDLWNHFQDFLTTGNECCYRPDFDPCWKFDL